MSATVWPRHVSCVLPVWPHITCESWLQAVTLERETLTLKTLASILKSQFHSGPSIALTRSGWRQEFVSPPNLEITFSVAESGPSLSPSLLLLPSLPLSPFLPLSCSFPLSLSVQAALPAWLSLPRGNEPRPAYSVQIMSRIKTESPLSRASSISASGPEASDTSSQRGRLFSAYPGVLSLLTAYVFPRWWDEWRWCYLGFACLMITLCGFVGFVYS